MGEHRGGGEDRRLSVSLGSLALTKDTSKNLITNCFNGLQVKVDIVHDYPAHRMQLYINDGLKWEGRDAGTGYKGGYNIKYGVYGTLKGSSAKVEWRNVKMWRG
jgi:hypothetical protein